MFAKNPVTFVKGSAIKTTKDGGTKVTANLAGGSTTSSMNYSAYTASQYNYMMSGLLPATPDLPDTSALALFYRDIYLHDNTAGSSVDIMSVFPFSDWELRGLDEKDLKPFSSAVDRLNLRELLPQLSTAYLTDGFYAGSLVFDAKARNFMDILTHDALQCNVTPSPFNNIDPSVRVTVSASTLQFLDSTSEYAKQYLQTMPQGFVSLLREGAFVLDPVTTMFVARRGLTDRAYQSYLHRILPMYLIEKTMYRGTLTEATRRQRAMSHITAGDDIWTPTSEELREIVQQFQDAERDPLGGWISTRNAVQVSDLRPGGDFWKWTDMADVMVAYKLRALGISEALLSGDASYASAESAYSTFLETTASFRTHLTNIVFYKKIFPLIAVANHKFKDPKRAEKTDSIVDFLFNTANRENLMQPVLHWHKDLTGKSEDSLMDMLEKLSEHNVPIPMKMWIAAAGVDKDTLIRDAKEDPELKKLLLGKGTNDEDELGDIEDQPTSASVHSQFMPKRRSILGRDFSTELFTIGKTGQKKSVYRADAKMKDVNHRISKIAAAVDKDRNYRDTLRKRNAARGQSIMKGVI